MSHPLHTIPSDGDMLCKQVVNLEHRVQSFGESVGRVETKVDKIVSTLESLVRIEERQAAINIRLAEGAETMQGLDSRVKAVEIKMPELESARSKVDKVVMTIVMAVVAALISLVVFKQ